MPIPFLSDISAQSGTFAGDLTVSGTYPKITLTDIDHNPDFTIIGGNGQFGIYDETNSTYRLQINSSGTTSFTGDIIQGSHLHTFANGAYLEIGTGASNTAQITFNADYDGAQTATYTPHYSGASSAGMSIIKMPSGGVGGIEFYVKKHGTTGGSHNLSTFNKILNLHQDGDSTFSGKVITTSTAAGAITINGGTGVSTTGAFVLRQNGNSDGNGMAITSGHVTSHRIWKDANGNLNIGSSGNSNAFKQDISGNLTIEGNITAAFDSNNSGNRLRIADTEGVSAAVRTYSTSDGTGLILNHYYAVSGSPYMRYSDFVSNMGDAAATTMRFLTKPHNGNPTVALTINNSQDATFEGRTTLQKDLRIRGSDASGGLGVVRFLTDSNNQLIIDTGNDGANRAIIDGSGNATFANNVSLGGDLNVNSVVQHHEAKYSAPKYYVSFDRTSSSDQYFKIITNAGGPKRIRLNITSSGDNTNTLDTYYISQSGYNMQTHIHRLPGSKYNTSKLVSVLSINPSAATQEVWIKLLGMSSGTGTTTVTANVPVSTSSDILASATTTKPTLSTGDSELDITTTDRNNYTTMSSGGAKFGGKINVGTSNEVDIVSSGSSLFPSLKVNNNGYVGSASVTDALQFQTSGDLKVKNKLGIGRSAVAKLTIEGDGGVNSNIFFQQSSSQEHRIYAATNNQYNTIGSSSPNWYWGQHQSSGSPTIKMSLVNDALTAGSFVKSGGTSSQFLMADGSVSTSVTNCDTVDNLHADDFLRSNATDTSSGKLTFGYSVGNLNSVGGAIGITPFRGSFQATNRPGSGNYFTGHEYTFSDSGARAQLGFGSDGQNTVPHIYARTERWSQTDAWQSWYRLYHTGYHPEADQWTTARTVTFATGDVTGSFTIDGSADVSNVALTVANDSHTHDDRYYTETESDAKYLLNTTDELDGDLTITGNLYVTGTSKTVNVEDLNVEQGEITLNYAAGSDTSGTANGAGIRIQDGVNGNTDVTMLWDKTSGYIDFSNSVEAPGFKSLASNSFREGMSTFETSLTNNDDWENSPISIRERDTIGNSSADNKYAPNLNFHWGSRISRSLWMSAQGDLYFGEYSSAGVPGINGKLFIYNLDVTNDATIDRDIQHGSFGNNNAEFAFGQTVANKVFSYGAEFQTLNSDIQIVLGRNDGTNVSGTGAIGASSTNAFHVYDTTDIVHLFQVAQTSGNATVKGTLTCGDVTSGRILATASGTGVHQLINASTNSTVLQLITTGDNPDHVLNLQSDHIYTGSLALHINTDTQNIYLRGAQTTVGTITPVSGYELTVVNGPGKSIHTSGTITTLGGVEFSTGLIKYEQNTDVDSAAAEAVASVVHATHTAAFFDYVIKKGTNVRAGVVAACHDGTNVEYAETSTVDLGDTSDVTLSVDISGTLMRLIATTTSNDWSVKSLIRAI